MSESPTEHIEHVEHAEHAAHSGDPTLAKVSVTIAILAVLAATVGSFETIESGYAINAKNESVLLQNQATDNWSFFQAQSVKRNMYDLAATTTTDEALKATYQAKSRGYEQDGKTARAKAEDLERERDVKLADSEHHEHRHHTLTAGVTLLHIAIAVATIAIITRGRRWPWYLAMALGVLGSALATFAYL